MASACLDANGKQAFGKPSKPVPRHGGLRKAAAVQTLASLIWIPQAALLATAVGRITNGGGFNDVLWLAIYIALLGIVNKLPRGHRWPYGISRSARRIVDAA